MERLRAEGEDGPLWEDWLLAGVVDQSGVRWEREARPTVQTVLRLDRLAASGRWLCGHQDSKIAWSQDQGMAYLRKEEDEKQERENKKEKMKHMAELWLRQEVKELEQEADQDSGLVVVDGG